MSTDTGMTVAHQKVKRLVATLTSLRGLLICLMALQAMLFLVPKGFAQEPEFSLKTLLMPGKLHQTHKQIETQCESCHEQKNDETQTQLCLNCHEDIANDIDQRHGFHGRSKQLVNVQCKACHSEHLGRDADIVGLDEDQFDHSATDFQLTGEHLKAACHSCHETDVAFRDASNQCVDCHREDDKHNGQLAQQCNECHDTSGWSKALFDHNSTGFELSGGHQQASCASCHPDERYKETPNQCYDCHILKDVHGGMNGRECADCHSEIEWTKSTFDHNKDTEFLLKGKHQLAQCTDCHVQAIFDQKPGDQCIDCHRFDDVHQGQNGSQCLDCHNETQWADTSFDHNLDTTFLLNGEHSNLQCVQCHQPNQQQKNRSECADCHANEDAHQGHLGSRCATCHSATGWLDDIQFSHDLSGFPLVGMHSVASCESCHGDLSFKDTPSECIDCHQTQDIHKGTMGQQCQNCHNPNDWLLWRFDHNQQTAFKLEGAHQGLSCEGCHSMSSPVDVSPGTQCVECHIQDDKHSGRFGRRCDSCHDTTSFANSRLN